MDRTLYSIELISELCAIAECGYKTDMPILAQRPRAIAASSSFVVLSATSFPFIAVPNLKLCDPIRDSQSLDGRQPLLTSRLDRWVDQQSGLGEAFTPTEEWLERLGDGERMRDGRIPIADRAAARKAKNSRPSPSIT
jgi:hypothetical protein